MDERSEEKVQELVNIQLSTFYILLFLHSSCQLFNNSCQMLSVACNPSFWLFSEWEPQWCFRMHFSHLQPLPDASLFLSHFIPKDLSHLSHLEGMLLLRRAVEKRARKSYKENVNNHRETTMTMRCLSPSQLENHIDIQDPHLDWIVTKQ